MLAPTAEEGDEGAPPDSADTAAAAADEAPDSGAADAAAEEDAGVRPTTPQEEAPPPPPAEEVKAPPPPPPVAQTPRITTLEALYSQYIDMCKLYACEPVQLLLDDIDTAITRGEPMPTIRLNGNCKQLFNKRPSEAQVLALTDALQHCTFIEDLDLSYNFLRDGAAKAVAGLLKVNPHLQRVFLAGNDIGPAGATQLASALTGMMEGRHALHTLDISGNPVGDEGGQYIAAMLRSNTSLKRLFAGSTHMGMRAVVAIASALQDGNTTLEVLDLSNPLSFTCQDEHATHFARVLAMHPRIAALSLARWRLHDSGLETLITYGALRNNTLSYLDLSSNRLSEESGRHLARMLATSSTLTTLRLASNELHDNGARAIADALPRNDSLTELDLAFNGISDAALHALAARLRQCPNIATVRLWGNKFGPAAAAAFGALIAEREGTLDCDVRVYEVDGVCHVAKVTAEY